MEEAGDEVEPEPVRDLPEALVEKIVAEIPFPHILKARALSKEWKSKLSRVVSTQAASRSWPEYFPFLICRGRVEGYNAVMNSAKRMGNGNIQLGGAPDAMVAVCGTLLVSLDSKPQQPVATVISLLICQKRKIICPKKPSRLDPISAVSDITSL